MPGKQSSDQWAELRDVALALETMSPYCTVLHFHRFEAVWPGAWQQNEWTTKLCVFKGTRPKPPVCEPSGCPWEKVRQGEHQGHGHAWHRARTFMYSSRANPQTWPADSSTRPKKPGNRALPAIYTDTGKGTLRGTGPGLAWQTEQPGSPVPSRVPLGMDCNTLTALPSRSSQQMGGALAKHP